LDKLLIQIFADIEKKGYPCFGKKNMLKNICDQIEKHASIYGCNKIIEGV
jgi:hypothetical protein